MNVELQSHLQRTKILCLTESPDNILMWAHYGQQHYGAVFRFDRAGEDNAFSAARPVDYRSDMPRFADAAGLAAMVAGRFQEARTISDSQIYTKANAWSYEREWRIQFGHGRDPRVAFEDLRYGDEHLSGVVMGCRMPTDDQAELAVLARGRNPAVELFRATPAQREFRMVLEPWEAATT